MSNEEKHHEFSPSKLKQLELCPGSWKLSQDLPDEPSEASKEGTAMHKAVETGKLLDVFNQEQLDCIQQCIDYLSMIAPSDAVWQKEEKITVLNDFDTLTEGTIDAVCVLPDRIIGVDWKFGRGLVNVENNPQIATYSAGLMQKYNLPVEFHIAQPRLHYFKSTRFEISQLRQIVDYIKGIIERCTSNSMLLNPSDDACRWCKAKGFCPAVNNVVDNTELTTIEHTADLTCDQIATYLEKTKVIEDVIARLKFRAKEKLMAGEEIRGWCLQNRQGKAKITEPQKAYDAVSGFVSMADFMNCIDVSTTKLVDTYAKNRKEAEGVTLKQSKAEIMEMLAQFIERGSDSISLVRKGE